MLVDSSPNEQNAAPNEEEEDWDALYESLTNPEPSEPIVESKPAPQAVAAPTEQAKPAPEPEYEYTWSGQKIKAPLSEVLKKASMGHDYAQQMAKFREERQSFETERTLSQKLREEYDPIDKWVRSNPDKWEKLQAVIQAEKDGHGELDVNHPLFQKYQSLEKTLNEKILPTIEAQENEKIRLKNEAEDKALDDEIKAIRDKYKDLAWDSVDEHGRSMEVRVVKHAAENGFKSFRAAFLDLYHDDLEKRAEERGKGTVVNERLKQAKTGLLGKTAAPTQGLKKAADIKQKSYNDLTAEALEELGLR
jgi:hypothetical protein